MVAQEHFYAESLEDFVAELGESGFNPVDGSDSPRWRGPIHPEFRDLTDAESMDIVIAPGWPFRPPALFVQGLNTNHSTLGGFVCLWQDGDFNLEWTTVGGLFSRIDEWCANARLGWEGQDLGLDALLNFKEKFAHAAIFDLPALGIRKGSWGDFHGSLTLDPIRVDILPGRRRSANELRGMWFELISEVSVLSVKPLKS